MKIYSKPKNDWQNLTAEFGNETKKHKIDLKTDEYEMLGIPFTNQIEWITEKSFALLNGCGTNCRYVLIFNTEIDNSLNLKIIETDSKKKEKVNLPKDWNRGSGQIYDIVDKIEIKNSKIKIVQYQENGIKKELNKLLTLK